MTDLTLKVDEHFFERIGKFSIPQQWVRKYTTQVMDFLAKCLVVDARMVEYSNSIEYAAYSSMFEVWDPKMEVPEYYIMIQWEADKFWFEVAPIKKSGEENETE